MIRKTFVPFVTVYVTSTLFLCYEYCYNALQRLFFSFVSQAMAQFERRKNLFRIVGSSMVV